MAPRAESAVPESATGGVMAVKKKRSGLTKRQREIYEFVRDLILNRGYGPTVREIGIKFEIQSPNGVMCHLKALEKKGLIIRESNMSRAIRLSYIPARRESIAFLGTAVSGSPFTAAVSSDERVEFDDLLDGGADRATLRVEGTAFTALGIADGDFLILSRDLQGRPGSLVAVLDDRHHMSLCRIPDDGGAPIPAIPGAFSAPRPEILGVVAGIVRQLEGNAGVNPESNGGVVPDEEE